LVFNQSEERKSLSSLVNFALIDQNSIQWVHPEARLLTERSLSNRRWLVLTFRSNQSSSIAQWALGEQSCFWMHPISISISSLI